MESVATNDFAVLGLILLPPLLGAVINGLIGRRLPKQLVWFIASASIGLSFTFGLYSAVSLFSASEMVEVEASHASGEEGEEVEPEHLRRTPRLEWVAFEWITSGDWTEGDDGYLPSEQFTVVEGERYVRCCFSGQGGGKEPAWAGECSMSFDACLQSLYTPTVPSVDAEGNPSAEAQEGIGGASARLKLSSHRFGGLHVEMKFAMDALSAFLVVMITFVGFLIHIYSIGYMRHDESKARFFSYLNLFVFAMLVLVLAGNLVVMFVGWEGVGLCSYLLIGFYYQDHANADAGKKAFIVNRVGDFAFVLGVLTLFFAFGTLDFVELERALDLGGMDPAAFRAMYPEMSNLLTLAAVLIFVGCTGKSAQIPLYVWLPDAMAGPTPVSALIHAATMVTAGVYLIARLHFVFVLSPAAMTVVAVVGALTALFAATIAITQNDIKKVLAYSTVSQLGYMFLAVGVGAWWVGIFHLLMHAFFKALLFLGSGSVIDAMHHEQDIRKMGGLRKKMPVTAITFLIGTLAIAGVPLLAGFFSKDQILWFAWFNRFPGGVGTVLAWALWGMGTLTAGLTAFYMFRLYFLTFEGECRAPKDVADHVTESPTSMIVPLSVLALLSVIGGYFGLPHLLAFGRESMEHSLRYVLSSEVNTLALSHSAEVAWEITLMVISVTVAAIGIGLAYVFYMKRREVPEQIVAKIPRVHRVLSNKYYVDELYAMTAVKGTLAIGAFFHRVVDVLLIDFLFIRGLAWLYQLGGNMLKYFQNGDLQRYAAYVMLGIVAVMYLVLV